MIEFKGKKEMKLNVTHSISAIFITILGFSFSGCENRPLGLSKQVNKPNQPIAELVAATGRIISPSSEDKVSPVFDYEIELRNPDETKFYYIANRIGELYWPKDRINLKSDVFTYRGKSSEGGNPPAGKFSVVLFEIDKTMHENIVRWMNGSSFPGIRIEGRELASVVVILRQ